MLSIKEIRELIDLVVDRGLSGLEIEKSGFRLRIEGRRPAVPEGYAAAPPPPQSPSRIPGNAPCWREDRSHIRNTRRFARGMLFLHGREAIGMVPIRVGAGGIS